MARSRWCTILNGSSRESATIASPIRGATHSGSSSRASRKLASASSSRPRFSRARPTASMTSGFSGAASRACSKRERASSRRPSLARVSPCSRYCSYSIPQIKSDEGGESVYNPLGEERGEALKNPPVIVRVAIRYKDLDPYGHVNNAVYLEFFEEIRLSYWHALADIMGF